MKNVKTELEWREHSSYSTFGEAKTKSVRLEMLIGKPTMICQSPTTKLWWILMGFNPKTTFINKTLDG